MSDLQQNQDNTVSSKSSLKSLLCCFSMCLKSKKLFTIAESNKQKWKQLGYKNEKQTLPPIFELLIDLYDGKDVYRALEDCRINPDYMPDHYIRNDLDYYIPQFTNFMILHEDFGNGRLKIFLEELSKTDAYFAHLYYWYITSLFPDVNQEKAQAILDQLLDHCASDSQNHLFLTEYEKFFLALEKKLPKEEYEAKMKEMQTRRMKALAAIQNYKLNQGLLTCGDSLVNASELELRPYISPLIQGGEAYRSNPFTSTLLFFEDLSIIADQITKLTDKLLHVKKFLHELNKALPSCVYVPFVKESIRHYTILNIVVDETKVFSTKERAPFYICMELYWPKEELAYEYNEMFEIKEKQRKINLLSWAKKKLRKATLKLPYHKMEDPIDTETDEQFKISKLNEQVSSPITLKKPGVPHEALVPNDKISRPQATGQSLVIFDNVTNSVQDGEYPISPQERMPCSLAMAANMKGRSCERRSSLEHYMTTLKRSASSPNDKTNYRPSAIEEHKTYAVKEVNIQINKFESTVTDITEEEKSEDEGKCNYAIDIEVDNADKSTRPNSTNQVKEDDPFFGEDSQAQTERIRRDSPFKSFKSWKLIHLIVKSGADMKEEQFALQLVSQFDQIFKAEKLKLLLTPYEIVSLGPDMGLLECLKDTTTLSSLKEKMYRQNINSLNDFFVYFYGKDVEKARKKFCRSLAAYSLICYFLQIKDRHNGNIMLHKNGNIIHIDYGFFLSSAPGRGLEFERKVPFKLLNEYVEVLGGPRSRLFQEFRRLFYKGFEACRKHSEQIIILVKMMYSSHGNTLPCFKAGDKTITELEKRFFPPKVNDKDLTGFCYSLINQSIDNWRAKCYDKYQYLCQGIFY